MKTVAFLLKRIGYSIFVLIGLSMVIFIISRVVPGDPARLAVGAHAPQWVVDDLRAYMHLDSPLPVQYFYWLYDALRGRLGISLATRRDVVADLVQFFPATLELAAYAAILMAIIGIPLGAISARNKDSWIDNVVRVFAYVGVVTPTFVFGIIFILLFSFYLQILPAMGRMSDTLQAPPVVTGLLTIDALLAGNSVVLIDAWKHLLMPAVALAMPGIAQQARITRSSMSSNLDKDYVAFERALGVPERVILWRFLLKPSLIPSVSVLFLDFAISIGNAFLLEIIFQWPGMARYGTQAMLNKDLNAVVGVVIATGLVFVFVNILVDIIVAALDPRIRLSAQREQ